MADLPRAAPELRSPERMRVLSSLIRSQVFTVILAWPRLPYLGERVRSLGGMPRTRFKGH
ncbi:hypothetical protein AB0J35_23050 [Nonomuraea angiospora]|uniref:hypothetical protein n=1 Tax=Nonomuraea angiospora TaxID=46172 RepID=UPI00341BEEA3